MSDNNTKTEQDGGEVAHEDPDDSVCTEFSVIDDEVVDENGEPLFAWAFECTRCGHDTPCKGDPKGFGGRPFSCTECAWVSLLDQDAIEEFAEEHYEEEEARSA